MTFLSAVIFCNSESRNNETSQKYNRIVDEAVMEVSIEKSFYCEKSCYNDGFSAERGLA